MKRRLEKILPTLALCSVLLGIGGAAGFLLRPVFLPVADVQDDPDDAVAVVDDMHDGSSIVDLLDVTMENMDLKVGKVDVRDYSKNIRIPAQVVERIPQGRRSITAPIGGRVTKVFITPGQAVREGEKLFELRITDESVSESQVKLLSMISEADVLEKQLDRLKPLVEKGVVARKRILELNFQIAKLVEQKAALVQELGIRGMTDQQIDDLIQTKQLVQSVFAFAPRWGAASSVKAVAQGADDASMISAVSVVLEPTESFDATYDDRYFTVDSISALEGTNLEMGQSLCELTHHGEMLIKGLAFESDVELISQANERDWRFSAHFGESSSGLIRENLKLFLVDNHVDRESQTFPILVEIDNEIISQTTDDQNRTYVNWRFKPGQRAHLEIPVEKWEKQIVVPLAALVREGLESFVFQKIGHTHESPEGTVHEFSKVPVQVLHTDQNYAVLKKNVRLDVYEDYALDQAYQLNLALKQAIGGGVDPHAGHSH